MTVFKAYLKILKKNLGMVIFYTMLMVIFAGLSLETSDNTVSFSQEKPDIVIINNDKEEGITKSFINYLNENANVKKITDKDEIKDAIFYHEISYVVYIPKNFRNDFILFKDVKVDVDSANDSDSNLASMLVENYLTKALKYRDIYYIEDDVIEKLNESLKTETKIDIKRTKDVNELDKMAFYFSYANYPILAGIIYVICLIMYSFNEIKIKKRNMVSSMDYKKFNKDLMLSNIVFLTFMFFVYTVLAFILKGSVVFSMNGLFHIINMLFFIICSLTMAFVISNLINNKNAINGVIQVIALGSSFLCGAFVPTSLLPNSVIKIAHIFPSYYYIKNNDIIKTIDTFNMTNIKPIIINMIIILGFSILFYVISLLIAKKKRTS